MVRPEGNREVRRSITHCGLDVALHVGCRVDPVEGKLLRRQATRMLTPTLPIAGAGDGERGKEALAMPGNSA